MSGDKLRDCPPCPICGNDATWETALTANIGGKEYVYGSCSECSCQADYHDWLARTNTTTELVEALLKAGAWFDDYARQHRAKLTQEGNLKADTNQERADYLRKALALHDRALGK